MLGVHYTFVQIVNVGHITPQHVYHMTPQDVYNTDFG